MFRSDSRQSATQMVILAILLALISGTLMITARAKHRPSLAVMTSSPFAFSEPSGSGPAAIQTMSTALTVPIISKKAPSDLPLPNGPGPLLWSDGDSTYRAVHFISVWDSGISAWRQISPDLTEADIVGAPGYGVDGITSVAHGHGVWYVGTLAGQLTNKLPGQDWSVINGNLPKRTITSIAILPGSASGQVAALGYGGYKAATPDTPGHVYLTRDGGASFLDVTGNLPDAPVQSLHFTTSDTTEILTVEVNNQWYVMQKPGHWTPLSN